MIIFRVLFIIFVGLLLVLIAIILLAGALTCGIVLFGISFVFLGTLSLSIPKQYKNE